MASVTRSNRQKSKTNALRFGGMRTTDTEPGRSVNPLETERPIGLFSSLKIELSVLITISTAIAFIMAWFLLKVGLSVWIAMPITLAVALGITYFFSRGLTSPLRQMRDAAEAMAEGDYTVRVHVDSNSRDEVGQLALTFNEMAEELQHADQMRRDMVANVSHELRTPVSALQAMVENMADGVIDPTPSNLESILNQTHRLSDLIAFLLDLSRMEAGAASLQIEMFNFADFLDETVEPLEIADAGHAHDIEMHVPDDIEMAGDQDRLRQLFTNIIANALKHSADNTTVLIEAHENKFRHHRHQCRQFRIADSARGAFRHFPPFRQRKNRSGHRIGRNRLGIVHRTLGRPVARWFGEGRR